MHSETETEVEHCKAITEQDNQEEEVVQPESSPLRDPMGEEELAAILTSMGEYGQPSSPAGPPDEPPEEDIPENSHAENQGEENPPVHEEEIRDTNGEQSVPEALEETLDRVGADLRASRKPSAEAREIKKLRTKQQRLLNTIAWLRQQIRILKASLRIQRTTRKRKRTTTAKSHRTRRRRTYTRPVG